MKKKIICLLLVVSILTVGAFALTACGKEKQGSFVSLSSQADVLLELNSSTSDVGIIDYTMANYLINKDGSDFKGKLTIVDSIEFDEEFYGVAFRKESKYLCAKVNEAMYQLQQNGKYAEIAAKYSLTNNSKTLPAVTVNDAEFTEADKADFNYIKNTKQKITVGITPNAPMDIFEGNAVTSGFDYDLAKETFKLVFGNEFEVAFKTIEWDNKLIDLNSGANNTGDYIDCIWNGLTITTERENAMAISNPYLINKQAVVVRVADASKYPTLESLKSATVAVESGSAGEDVAKELFK